MRNTAERNRSSRFVGHLYVTIVVVVALVLSACAEDGNDVEDANGAEATQPEEEEDVTEEPDDTDESDDPIVVQYATGNSDDIAETLMAQWWMDEVTERTDGRIEFEPFWGGSLHGALEVSPAVWDGRLDAGYASTAYHVDELAMWELVGIPFLGDNEIATMLTFRDLYEENELLRAEFRDRNMHMVAFHPTGPASTITSEPVESLDDLAGMRLRAVGLIGQAYSSVDADPVAIDPAEMYESIQRGVIEGVGSLPFDTVPSFGLHEVAPYITNVGIGVYANTGIVMNLELFESLPSDIQQIMNEVGQEVMGAPSVQYATQVGDETCQTILDAGGTVTSLSEDETQAWADEELDGMLEAYISNTSETTGHSEGDIREYVERFQELYAMHEAESDYTTSLVRCATR